MPKYTVAKYIYEGTFEYMIRLHCRQAPGKATYKTWYLSNKDYTLNQVKLYRNARMAELEKVGLRGGCRKMLTSDTIGMM